MTASKKKKEKAKDFAKANFKLGKGKLKSANATDTSFSSRSIALTQQSITRDNAGVPTTKRNLTLEDLQTHLKHYSASTRKDALSGLRELLTAHPWLGESSVGSLVPLLARMIGDEEQSVRKALLAFLAWYLPGLPAIILQPHHSVLLFFATSAMSHIYPEIRMDAVRALNIMLDTFPESIALSWSGELNASRQANNEDDLPTKVLECYLSLLHIRSGITTNGLRTDMSPTAKALVLSSLATFLRLSTAPEGPTAAATRQDRALPDIPTWFMAPVFPTQRAYQSFVEQVASTSGARFSSLRTPNDQSCLIASEGLLRQERHLALSSISDIFTDITSIGLDSSNPQDLPSTPEQLLKTLLPILISAFLDSGPTAFSPEASAAPSTSTALEAATNTVIAVAEISRDLWRSVLLRNMHVMGSNQHAEIVSGLEKLVAHMAVYFPFGNDELLKRSSSDSSKLQSLNITFCELVALVGLGSQHQNNQQQAGGKVRKSRSKVDSAKASMSNYVESLLSSAKSSSILSSSTTVTPHMYSQLLPTIWSLLGASENSKEESNILETLVHHFLALAPISGVKKLAFKFIMRLLMLPDLCSAVKLLPCGQRIQRLKSNQLHEEFLLALPRYIWELSTKDEDFSRCILLYIQHALVVGTISVSTTEKLASYLSPYFMTQHPKKGSIPGPWTKLEEERSIIKALETAWWVRVGDIPAGSSTAFSAAVESAIKARASDQLSLYWSILASNES